MTSIRVDDLPAVVLQVKRDQSPCVSGFDGIRPKRISDCEWTVHRNFTLRQGITTAWEHLSQS